MKTYTVLILCMILLRIPSCKQKKEGKHLFILSGLYNQLCNDLENYELNLIIGRLSDFDMQSEKYPPWVMIRDTQVKVAESNPRFGWINTDDLHMSAEGYIILGKRFADKAIQLIENN